MFPPFLTENSWNIFPATIQLLFMSKVAENARMCKRTTHVISITLDEFIIWACCEFVNCFLKKYLYYTDWSERGDFIMSENRVLQEHLIYEILSVVGEIPEGCVATYGQIARLIGRDKNARLVGKALSMADGYGDYPCHRVVDHSGRLVPGWKEQGILLTNHVLPV